MTTDEKLDKILELLYLLVPQHMLPEEDKVYSETEQESLVLREFEKLAKYDRPQRLDARFPQECIPELDLTGDQPVMERVPFSILASRCCARKCFPSKAVVEIVAKGLGFHILTLHDCGLRRNGKPQIIMTAEEHRKLLDLPPEAVTEVVVDEPDTREVVEEPTTVKVVVPKKPEQKWAYEPDEPLPPSDFPPDDDWEEEEVTELEIIREEKPVVKGLDIKIKKTLEK